MKRQITFVLDLTDEELTRIVPSGNVWVVLHAYSSATEYTAVTSGWVEISVMDLARSLSQKKELTSD